MSKIIIILSLISSAFAFSGVTTRSVSSSLQMATEFSKSLPFLKKPKNLEGLVGDAEFDPFGFAENFDPKWLRESELKHGRVAMLATVGWLVQVLFYYVMVFYWIDFVAFFKAAGIHLPSPDGRYDVANPIDAFFHVGASPIAQIFITIGALESINHNGKLSQADMFVDSDRGVGEFSLPIYGASQLKGKSPALIADLKLKELKNGRLAMLAIGGLVHQTIISGTETFGTFPNPNLWSLY